MIIKKSITSRKRRHIRLRKRVVGTAEKPRLNVYRSLKNFYVQAVDDISGKVIFSVSTLDKELKSKLKYGGNIKATEPLAEVVAKRAKEKGVKRIVFDRGGYLFHGRVKALAQNLRKQGMEF